MTDIYVTDHVVPGAAEYIALRKTGGLSGFPESAAGDGLPRSVYVVCIRQRGALIAMGRIVGDGACFLQICDIVVDPGHRGRGLAKQVMRSVMTFIDTQLPKEAFVSLLADVPADALYTQFGFRSTAPRSVGMAYVRARAEP